MSRNSIVIWASFALLSLAANGLNIGSLRGNALPQITTPEKASASAYTAFQVYPPVLAVNSAKELIATNGAPDSPLEVIASSVESCQQTLVRHSFAYSYGTPYVVPYTPPACSFNHVVWNLTTRTSGYQYDRQGTVSFNNTELFRTTTVEPDSGLTVYSYLKDMTPYLSLFKSNHSLIFDLPNVLEGQIQGDYNVTLTASYFTIESSYEPADRIFPIGQNLGSEGQPSYFIFPEQNASSTITLPRNIKKAVYTVVAVGQANEEFWWDAYLNSEVDTFPASPGSQYSPFREVQVYIDGQLAGVAWPFPILFSGAVDPDLWRPIAGVDILDLKEYEIDITPWLPLLCNGEPHTFAMRVSGLNDTGGNGTATLSQTTEDDWYLGGKIFVWLDKEGHVTTGDGPHRTTSAPHFQVSSHVTANHTSKANESLTFSVDAERNLCLSSTIKLSTGSQSVFWSQRLAFTANASVTDSGEYELYHQDTSGYEVSSSGYALEFTYPFVAELLAQKTGFNYGKTAKVLGPAVFPTGLDTFFSNTTGTGVSRSIVQDAVVTSNGHTASANLQLAAIEVGTAPGTETFPPIKKSTPLFTQNAIASDDKLTSDVVKFSTKPDIVL